MKIFHFIICNLIFSSLYWLLILILVKISFFQKRRYYTILRLKFRFWLFFVKYKFRLQANFEILLFWRQNNLIYTKIFSYFCHILVISWDYLIPKATINCYLIWLYYNLGTKRTLRSIRRRAEKIQKDAKGIHKTLENDKLRRQQIQHTSLIIDSINERLEQHVILRVEHANERRRQQDTNSSQSHTIVDQHEHESAEHVDLRAADPLEELGRIQLLVKVQSEQREPAWVEQTAYILRHGERWDAACDALLVKTNTTLVKRVQYRSGSLPKVAYSTSLQLGQLQTDAQLKQRVAGKHGADEWAVVFEAPLDVFEQSWQVIDPMETWTICPNLACWVEKFTHVETGALLQAADHQFERVVSKGQSFFLVKDTFVHVNAFFGQLGLLLKSDDDHWSTRVMWLEMMTGRWARNWPASFRTCRTCGFSWPSPSKDTLWVNKSSFKQLGCPVLVTLVKCLDT